MVSLRWFTLFILKIHNLFDFYHISWSLRWKLDGEYGRLYLYYSESVESYVLLLCNMQGEFFFLAYRRKTFQTGL